jgi:hypothetical protein
MRTVATALPVAHQELATGWPVIVACTAAAIFAWGFGAFGPAVYFAELKERYGWPAATIGGATTLALSPARYSCRSSVRLSSGSGRAACSRPAFC